MEIAGSYVIHNEQGEQDSKGRISITGQHAVMVFLLLKFKFAVVLFDRLNQAISDGQQAFGILVV